MRHVRRAIGGLVVLLILGLAGLAIYALTRSRPQDLPWTPLDLSQPAGLFTGRKIAALGHDLTACRAVLDQAGVRYSVLPKVASGQCGYANGVRLTAGGARRIGFAPVGVALSCPVAAGLSAWEWDVVQPAARRYFGQRVVSIDHYGSYSCRRIYGRPQGDFSEHASANALDVAGFRLEDGTRITVLGDWQDQGAKSSFLRTVRTGACDMFATVLSPDYNAAHRDHLHLDQADRGTMGWRACR